MAKSYEIEVFSQPNLYDPKRRSMHVYFCEPEQGIDKNTGLLLFIAGYGGDANANVYLKMRNRFADQYNLVTIQCNYFGWEYMQAPGDVYITQDMLKDYLSTEEISKLFENYEENCGLLQGKNIYYNEYLDETPDCFNEMGPVQAMDHLIALKVVIDILHQNGYSYNQRKVIAYGQSHGGYLAYLCNALMRNVFTYIIDNSAYLFPTYLHQSRGIVYNRSGCNIHRQISYIAEQLIDDEGVYDLKKVYCQITNHAKIISYHGAEDELISHKEKEAFINKTSNAYLELIDASRVDNTIFKSLHHGLGADFIKLFEYTIDKYGLDDGISGGVFGPSDLETEKYIYHIDICEGIPVLDRIQK